MTSPALRPVTRSPRSRTRRPLALRLGAVSAVAVALTATGVASASAHVELGSDSTTAGSSSELVLRVPNESESAATVRVSVQLPQDRPFLEVSTRALPGWTAVQTEARLPQPVQYEGTTLTKAVRTVTWTADRGVRLTDGQYQDFALAVEPLPAAGTLLLPTVQTYSDGTVVRWDQPTPATGEEPEHPAPQLEVTAAAPDTPVAPATGGPDVTARWLGGSALAVAAAGAALAAAGLRRRRAGTGSRSA